MTRTAPLCAECPPVTPRAGLVVVDLDGTVLDADDLLHPADRAALRAVASSTSTTVAVATARPTTDAIRWAVEIGASECIALGGAVVISGSMPLWTAQRLSSGVISHLRTLAETHGADLHLHTVTGWHPCADTPTARAYGRRHRLTALPAPVEGGHVLMAELVAAPGVLSAVTPGGPLTSESPVVSATEDAHASYLVVTPTGVDKRQAVARLLEAAALDWGSVLALGDGALDAPVLAAARTGVAVGRAHPLALASATHRLTGGPGGGSIAAALDALYYCASRAHPLVTCLHRRESQ